MDLNLDEICEFFKHPQQLMPKSILGAVCTGHRFTRGNLETGIIELNSLRLWAPEIAKQIKPEGNGQALMFGKYKLLSIKFIILLLVNIVEVLI
jgi:hypothetical protein